VDPSAHREGAKRTFEEYNSDTYLYLEDLKAQIINKTAGKGIIVVKFSMDSALLNKEVRAKLNIHRVFVKCPSDALKKLQDTLPLCTTEKAKNKTNENGYYLTFIADNISRVKSQDIIANILNIPTPTTFTLSTQASRSNLTTTSSAATSTVQATESRFFTGSSASAAPSSTAVQTSTFASTASKGS
jgi:hypothetical protein